MISGDAVKFAFVEMRSVEEASNAISLDGIVFEGVRVKIRRPSDYNPSLAAPLGPSQPNPNLNLAAVGLPPPSGLEGPDCIFVSGLPYYFTEAQVRELLESFGLLSIFDLVIDRETGYSKGYAFCVYQNLYVTDIACWALDGVKLGDKTLTVRRASHGQIHMNPEQENAFLLAQQQMALQVSKRVELAHILFGLTLEPVATGTPLTKVLSLTQMVTEEELIDDVEYEDILEDIKIECGKFGSLVSVVIPRPNPNSGLVTGVGKVFLEYADTVSSRKAWAGLNGRRFGGNQVVVSFYPENKFSKGEYDG
ncbi:splicing factor U2af large subunit B-like [Bidens hawaiensis]|uniref:splicing factor U2af large subunit B-like n=1 Tax=Bidens hawaiensis TaxID=980011 RepID=UPI00404B3F28